MKEKSRCFEVDVAPIEIHQGLLDEENVYFELEDVGSCPSLDALRDLEEVIICHEMI